MDHEDLKIRTKNFAVQIIKLAQYLEKNQGNTGRKIGDQIMRSGTGIFANYRAACWCKSAKDFISKMGTVVEEADETLGWLELLIASNLIDEKSYQGLINEAS